MFDSTTRYLSRADILYELYRRPGLIPVELDPDKEQLLWLDMPQYHIYEGRFRTAVSAFTGISQCTSRKVKPVTFKTDIDVLESDEVLVDTLYPSGFIFNMSRCGSTLVAKALARLRTNLVLSEAAPHTKIWQYLAGEEPTQLVFNARNRSIYRNLILAMGRKRLLDYNVYFIKFTSFNILFFNQIMQAFPDVPAVFLYRNPAEVLVSLTQRGAAWQSIQNTEWGNYLCQSNHAEKLDSLSYYSHALNHFMQAALDNENSGLCYLNYDRIKADNFAEILSSFDMDFTSQQLAVMQYQFSHYSKSEYNTVPFNSDTRIKQKSITPEITAITQNQLGALFHQLLQSSQNIG